MTASALYIPDVGIKIYSMFGLHAYYALIIGAVARYDWQYLLLGARAFRVLPHTKR